MDTGYRIGAVAKLTGISTDTIRAWERRYKVVEPNRGDNNNRYYNEGHIRKLISVKRLVDAGQAIGTVCRLNETELQDRINGLLNVRHSSPVGPLKKWAVISVQKPAWLKACVSAQPGVEPSWISSLEDLSVTGFEFIIVDMPSLSEVNEKLVLRLIPEILAPNCLVVYKFASRTQLRELTARGFRLLKGPLAPFALVNLLSDVSHAFEASSNEGESPVSKPDQGDDMLVQYRARLSGLVKALDQLEQHACQNSLSGNIESEQVLAHMVESAARARAILEAALTTVPESKEPDYNEDKKADLVN